MANGYALQEANLTPGVVREQLRLHGWTLMSVGAAFGFCGGFSAGLFGAILTAMSWFAGSHFHGFALQRDGTILLFLTIPLLVFGHIVSTFSRNELTKESGMK